MKTAPLSALARLGSCLERSEKYMPLSPKEKFSPEELRLLFRYEPETGLLFWRDDQFRSRIKAGSKAGNRKPYGYVRIQCKGEWLLAHRVAWAIHFGAWPKGCIDHANKDRGDNRICNLREASHEQNMRNRTANKRNPTGLKGVSQEGGSFRARITSGGVRHNLGSFSSAGAASAAYAEAASRLHGEFASI